MGYHQWKQNRTTKQRAGVVIHQHTDDDHEEIDHRQNDNFAISHAPLTNWRVKNGLPLAVDIILYRVKRHKALTVRIAELTEDLEELRSEKALLLQKFEYAEDVGAEAFRKDIATMETGLKKLEAQEQKYSVELDKALTEYAELKAQTADFDPVELYKARNAIRPVQEKEVEQKLEGTMHEKPSLIMLLSAKQETSRLLGEDAENRQARQKIMRRRSTEQLKRPHLKTDRCKIER